MKKLLFLITTCSVFLVSCSKESNSFINDEVSEFTNAQSKSNPSFEESVAIIQKGIIEIDGRFALLLELKDFSENFRLPNAIMIDGIEYGDGGEFNDQIKGDGIYTSANLYDLSTEVREILEQANSTIYNIAPEFHHMSKLENYLNLKNFFGISVGCQIRLVKCPQTSWYNKCIGSDECTCIEFYDCYAQFNFGL